MFHCRDWLIGNITGSPIPTQELTNTSTYTGTTTWAGYTYQNNIKYTGGLLDNTSYGINHNWSVGVNGMNAVDGLVAVIEVKLTGTPPSHKSYVISSSPFYRSEMGFLAKRPAWQMLPVFWQLLMVFPVIGLVLSS